MTDSAEAPRRRATRLVFLVVLLDLIGFGIVLPLLSGAGARFESDAFLIGLLVAMDSLLSILVQPRWGRLSDRTGRRPIVLVGIAASVASYLLFGLAQSFLILFLSRIVSGLFGTTVTIAQAALADVSPPERRSQALGLIGAAYGVAFTVGPLIGGIALRQGGDALPGLIAAGCSALNLVLAAFLFPETRTERVPAATPARGSLPLTMPVTIYFAVTLAFTVTYSIFPLFLQRTFGLPRTKVSYLFALLGLVTVIVQGRLIGPLVRRFGERRMAAAGALLLAAGFGGVPLLAYGAGLVPVLLALALLVTLFSAGYSVAGTAVTALVSRSAGPAGQGFVLGRLQSLGAIARAAGPPMVGLLADAAGLAAPLVAASAAAAAAGLVAARSEARVTAAP